MSSHAKTVGNWIASRPVRSFFVSSEVPGPTGAVETALSRLAANGGPIRRVRQGLYWKEPPVTAFGVAQPDPTEAAFAVAGAGAGISGMSAANAFGLSTQVPRQPVIAVVGRPPKGINGVRFVHRSNPHRITLSRLEVAFLEVLIDFDETSEVNWTPARPRLRRIANESSIDLRKVAAVASHERQAGLLTRIESLDDNERRGFGVGSQ